MASLSLSASVPTTTSSPTLSALRTHHTHSLIARWGTRAVLSTVGSEKDNYQQKLPAIQFQFRNLFPYHSVCSAAAPKEQKLQVYL